MYKAVILLAPGFQDEEVVYPYYRMLEEGWEVELWSADGGNVRGKSGTPFPTQDQFGGRPEVVLIPGGWECPEKLRMAQVVTDFLRLRNGAGDLIAAICHGPQVLISAGIVKGRTVTGYPGIRDDLINAGAIYPTEPVVRDGNLITAQHYRDLPEFMREIIAYMRTVQPRAYAESHAI